MKLNEVAISEDNTGKSVVFTFGRFSVPTRGHEKLIDTVATVARNKGADHAIFVSQKQDLPKNPLSWDTKKRYLELFFPGIRISDNKSVKTPYQALEVLGKSYDTVYLVVGKDRYSEFAQGMEKYLDDFGIKNFEVISAGERDPESDSIQGISATRARLAAKENDFESFRDMLPTRANDKSAKDLFLSLQKELLS